MKKTDKDTIKDTILGLIICIIAFVVGIFMLYNADDWFLTKISYIIGFVLVVIGILPLFELFFIIKKSIPTQKNIIQRQKDIIQRKREEQRLLNSKQRMIDQVKEVKDKNKRFEDKLIELSLKYGKITSLVSYYYVDPEWLFKYRDMVSSYCEIVGKNDYESSFRKIEKSIIVFEDTSSILINNIIYSFNNIISYEVFDNAETTHSGSVHNSTTKGSTGNIIGRALVGGMLMGGTGAVIGGATAKKSTETISQSSSSYTSHNYNIAIIINNLSDSLIKIELGSQQDKMQEIASILTIIIERNKI